MDPLAVSLTLLIVGFAIIVLELFIPSGGILSLLAIAAFSGSIYYAFMRSTATGFSFLFGTLVAVPILISLAVKYWPMTPMGKAILGELPTEDEVKPSDPRRDLLGKVGIARSKMLPSGAIEIEGEMIDAVTQGLAVDPGQYVLVIEVRSNRVVVRPLEDDERTDARRPEDLLAKPIDELGIESLEDPLA